MSNICRRLFKKKDNKMGIFFKVNHYKAIEALVWLSSKKPRIALNEAVNILFRADKLHVNRYARPVTGDTYLCINDGPTPMAIRDIILKDKKIDHVVIDYFDSSISIVNSIPQSISPKREVNLDYFSSTDIECLLEVLNQTNKSSIDLSDGINCFSSVGPNKPIDYALLVDKNNPYHDDIIAEMYETSRHLQV